MAQNSQLQNILNRSFPGANLLECSLVCDTNVDLPFYKNKFFFFVSVTPGVQGQNGQRSFNKDGRITLKAEVEKVIALAESIELWAKGHGKTFGNFSIFADTSKSSYNNSGTGTIKSCFISEWTPNAKDGGQPDPTKRQVYVSFKSGQAQPIGCGYSPSDALAIAHIIKKMADKALDLEFNSRTNSVGPANTPPAQPRQTNNQQGGYQQQNQQQGPPPNQQQGPPPNQQQGNGQNPNQNPPPNNTQNVVNDFQQGMNSAQGNQQTNTQQSGPPPGITDDMPF